MHDPLESSRVLYYKHLLSLLNQDCLHVLQIQVYAQRLNQGTQEPLRQLQSPFEQHFPRHALNYLQYFQRPVDKIILTFQLKDVHI